jgi:hypothetical protein
VGLFAYHALGRAESSVWPAVLAVLRVLFLTTGHLIYQVWLVNRRQKTVEHRESDNDLEKG